MRAARQHVVLHHAARRAAAVATDSSLHALFAATLRAVGVARTSGVAGGGGLAWRRS